MNVLTRISHRLVGEGYILLKNNDMKVLAEDRLFDRIRQQASSPAAVARLWRATASGCYPADAGLLAEPGPRLAGVLVNLVR